MKILKKKTESLRDGISLFLYNLTQDIQDVDMYSIHNLQYAIYLFIGLLSSDSLTPIPNI